MYILRIKGTHKFAVRKVKHFLMLQQVVNT